MEIIRPTVKPTGKQHEAWNRLTDKTTEFIVYGGAAGGGKTWLGCEWLLTSCFHYPGTKYFIGREGLQDIRESTIITFYKVLSHHGIKSATLFKYNGQDHFFQFHNGSRIDLVELKYYPSDPLYERFGSMEFTSGWIEEGGEVDDLAAQMISSRTGRMLNDKYGLLGKTLITCNPKKNFLYYDYYQPWKEDRLEENKAFIQAFVDDNVYGESGYAAKLDGLKGVAYQRLRKGNWEYDDDPCQLVLYEKILDCFTNRHVPHGEGYITADIARFGQDATVLGDWSGYRVKPHKYVKLSVPQSAARIQELQDRKKIPNSRTTADEDGVGGGVVDIVECKGFVNNSRALPNPNTLIVENFDNLRSQCYFRLADLINAGGLYIDCTPEEKKLIIQELEQIKQKNVDDEGKKKGVISREEIIKNIGRSPDYLSMLMQRMVFDLQFNFKVAVA